MSDSAEQLAVVTDTSVPEAQIATGNIYKDKCPCVDKEWLKYQEEHKTIDPTVIENLVNKKEAELRTEFHETLTKEISLLKEKFDFILYNEQVRASFMLREAYRERQEKIKALQSQLECKNMAGMMYVVATERRKSKMEKMKLVEQYTNYIESLNVILADGQQIIRYLSKGYKTAARLDKEWKEKLQLVVGEFQKFVEQYMQGSTDTCQYFFDMPKLMQAKARIEDNPEEIPIDEEDPIPDNRPEIWWEQLDGDCRPFAVVGETEFDASMQRAGLKRVRAKKTAPRIWKEYVFNEMFQKSGCMHANDVKDLCAHNIPSQTRWECQGVQTDVGLSPSDRFFRRHTTASIDMRGTMGSIVKLINASGLNHAETKATLLGARDSMEIVSTTKLREMEEKRQKSIETIQSPDKLVIGRRKTSLFDSNSKDGGPDLKFREMQKSRIGKNESLSDSLIWMEHQSNPEAPPHHSETSEPDVDKKVCPREVCRRMRMDSFLHSLPAYMKVKRLTHNQQTFENYQACTLEQIEMLQKRIQDKKAKDKHTKDLLGDDHQKDLISVNEAVGTQASDYSLSDVLSVCTCSSGTATTVSSSEGNAVNVADLIAVKQQLDAIPKDYLYDDNIEFNRFKVLGHESHASENPEPFDEPTDLISNRLYKIKKILNQYPSLCSIMQTNARC